MMNLLLLGVPIDTRPYHERYPENKDDEEEEEDEEEKDKKADDQSIF